jgi:hypothetical protein
MSQRFEGATTTPDDEIPDSSVVPEPERPPRPILVELGSAILIVGGFTAILGWLGAQIAGATIPADAGLLPAIVVGLNVVAIVTGVLIRNGSHWRLCVNIVAVAIFLYLSAFPNPMAVFFGFLDTIVFFGLIRHRAWFEWKPPEASRASVPS